MTPILIVDDDDQVLSMLERLLQRDGYDCLVAKDAAEARTVLQRQPISAALLDVGLPGESGLELVKYVRAHYPDTAVVMVTGSDDPQLAKIAMHDGAYGYVVKPFRPNELLINVSGALHRRSLEIRNREQTQQALQYQTFHDALTGLPNRQLLSDRLGQALQLARGSGRLLALLMLDLDHFKEVNETFGHRAGDLLLGQIGPRLQSELGEGDMIARLGGDEFAVLLSDANEMAAKVVAEKLLAAFDQPFEVEGQLFDIAASIGIATFPKDGDSADSLLRRADIALFVAKRTRGAYVSYSPEHEKLGASRLTLMAELRQAIHREQLFLHFQPMVSLRDETLTGVEALVRWNHPEHGLVPPVEFIPFAEKTRLIQPLTRWVLTAALRQCQVWHQGGRTIPVAVNISMRDLVDPELPELIASTLRATGAQPSWLRLEITESVIMADPERAIDTLDRLRRLGVRLGIDDFGTGYSSLAYLHRLPVDEIKIDRSFLSQMVGTTRGGGANIVRAAIDLGHSLRLESVAEGVEDARTWDLLVALGCDTAQGYYIGRPMAAGAVLPWLAQREVRDSSEIKEAEKQAA